jgi:hypothetical protein
MKRAMVAATRAAVGEEGNGKGGESDGDAYKEGDGEEEGECKGGESDGDGKEDGEGDKGDGDGDKEGDGEEEGDEAKTGCARGWRRGRLHPTTNGWQRI